MALLTPAIWTAINNHFEGAGIGEKARPNPLRVCEASVFELVHLQQVFCAFQAWIGTRKNSSDHCAVERLAAAISMLGCPSD
jgi:hypothetical protein